MKARFASRGVGPGGFPWLQVSVWRSGPIFAIELVRGVSSMIVVKVCSMKILMWRQGWELSWENKRMVCKRSEASQGIYLVTEEVAEMEAWFAYRGFVSARLGIKWAVHWCAEVRCSFCFLFAFPWMLRTCSHKRRLIRIIECESTGKTLRGRRYWELKINIIAWEIYAYTRDHGDYMHPRWGDGILWKDTDGERSITMRRK